MRLIVECEHGEDQPHALPKSYIFCWGRTITDPDAILAALAEAGVLGVEPTAEYAEYPDGRNHGPSADEQWFEVPHVRYVSPWKEAK